MAKTQRRCASWASPRSRMDSRRKSLRSRQSAEGPATPSPAPRDLVREAGANAVAAAAATAGVLGGTGTEVRAARLRFEPAALPPAATGDAEPDGAADNTATAAGDVGTGAAAAAVGAAGGGRPSAKPGPRRAVRRRGCGPGPLGLLCGIAADSTSTMSSSSSTAAAAAATSSLSSRRSMTPPPPPPRRARLIRRSPAIECMQQGREIGTHRGRGPEAA